MAGIPVAVGADSWRASGKIFLVDELICQVSCATSALHVVIALSLSRCTLVGVIATFNSNRRYYNYYKKMPCL